MVSITSATQLEDAQQIFAGKSCSLIGRRRLEKLEFEIDINKNMLQQPMNAWDSVQITKYFQWPLKPLKVGFTINLNHQPSVLVD